MLIYRIYNPFTRVFPSTYSQIQYCLIVFLIQDLEKKRRALNGGRRRANMVGVCTDLLSLVFGLLHFIDQLSVRGVCKAWRSDGWSNHDPNQLPTAVWVMQQMLADASPTSTTYTLTDLSTNLSYTMDILGRVQYFDGEGRLAAGKGAISSSRLVPCLLL